MARRFAPKKQLFGEPDEKNDDTTSCRDYEGEDKSEEYILRKVISAVENSVGEN